MTGAEAHETAARSALTTVILQLLAGEQVTGDPVLRHAGELVDAHYGWVRLLAECEALIATEPDLIGPDVEDLLRRIRAMPGIPAMTTREQS